MLASHVRTQKQRDGRRVSHLFRSPNPPLCAYHASRSTTDWLEAQTSRRGRRSLDQPRRAFGAKLLVENTCVLYSSNHMHVGVIISFNDRTETGILQSSDGEGHDISFKYCNGSTVAISDSEKSPYLTDRKPTRPGTSLKVPRLGDPIVFTMGRNDSAESWAYAETYVDLCRRKYSSEFVRGT
jgi:hypothetical protein